MAGGLRRAIAAMAICVAAFGAMDAACPGVERAAADWRLQAHIEGERFRPNLPLLGISCPSSSLCVAVGELDTVVSSRNPTGGGSAWDQVKPSGEAETDCHPSNLPPCQPVEDRVIRGVSCPSAGLCVAVTGEGYVYWSTDPTGPATGWRVADIDGTGRDTHLLGVSCPTVSLCVAVSGERHTSGKVLTSTDPTGGASAWKVAQLDESLDLRGVSCGTPALCVAVAEQGRLLVSTNPTGGASVWKEIGMPGGPADLQGVSCAATVLCVAGNEVGGLLTSASPAAASSWEEGQSGASVQVTGVSCLPSRQCAAVDNNGDVITSLDPTGGGAWSRTRLIPYVQPPGDHEEPLNGLFGVSCASSTLCAIVGSDGRIYTSTDPFAPPSGPSQGDGSRKRVRRPRVTIAKLILPSGRELGHGRGRVRARFFANGPVRRFECKLPGRRFRRCRSPKSFPVGKKGTFALRIRAVGSTGLRGPAAVKRFYIGTRCKRHACFGPDGELPLRRR